MTIRMTNQERINHAEELLAYYTADKYMERRHWKVINFLRTIKNLARKKRTPTPGQRKFLEDLIARGTPEVATNPEAAKYEAFLPYINNTFQLNAAKDLISALKNNVNLSPKQRAFLDQIISNAKANMECKPLVLTVEKLRQLEILSEAMAYSGNTNNHRKAFLKRELGIRALICKSLKEYCDYTDEQIVDAVNIVVGNSVSVSDVVPDADENTDLAFIVNHVDTYRNKGNIVQLFERDWKDAFELYSKTIADIKKVKENVRFAVGNMIQFKSKHLEGRRSFVQGLLSNSDIELQEGENPMCLIVNSPYVKYGNIHYYQNGLVIDVMIGTKVYTCSYQYFSRAKIKGF